MEDKHYVYSARTTEKGLGLINKARGDKSWDKFLNEAVAGQYGIPVSNLMLPPSKAKKEVSAKLAAAAKLAALGKAKAGVKAKADKAKADNKPKIRKTVDVTVAPGEVKEVGGTRVSAPADNTHPVTVPVEIEEN